MKALVIVESPAKAKTISKYLGSNYIVKASMGHVKDLPKTKLGVNEENFEATFHIIKEKAKVVKELKDISKGISTIYLASDPDREGEAISFHIAEVLQGDSRNIQRILLHEITEKAVKEAISNPSSIDFKKVDAQYARRILDRLVGYKISPLLWEKVKRGLSAGRVQSVALRLICDREKEIKAFVSEEYWLIDAILSAKQPPSFSARLVKKGRNKITIKNQEEVQVIERELEKNDYIVKDISKKEKQRHPSPPYITSKLQQEGVRRLKLSVSKIMQVAQRLYEGIDLGSGEREGLITYMRTDSVRISEGALRDARQFVSNNFGNDYLPDSPRVFKNKKTTQDAHEAIRPTSVSRTPDSMKQFLSNEEFRLYEMIWQRFVASQMNPYRYLETKIEIENGSYLFEAKGHTAIFDGYMKIYHEEQLEEQNQNNNDSSAEDKKLPAVEPGDILNLEELRKEQKFTQPPPRYSEATLVKELEDKEIGRPSTYATILHVLQNRNYVVKQEGKFHPTDLGMVIVDLLIEHFHDLMDVKYTASMENKLDEIEEGTRNKIDILKDFYDGFKDQLQSAHSSMKNIKMEGIPASHACPQCKQPVVQKWGRYGSYYECTNQTCKYRFNDPHEDTQAIDIPDESCPNCNSKMILKKGRYGQFLACQKYPECKTTKSLTSNKELGKCPQCNSALVERRSRYGTFTACSNYPSCTYIPGKEKSKCPNEDCDGKIVRKRTKSGKFFYGCSNYPECKFVSWKKPQQDREAL